MTTSNLIRIKYPLSIFNYHLSGVKVANFNKIHCTVFEQQLFKKMELKNRSFQYGKVALAVRTQYHQLQSGRHLHKHLHVSCADRTFSAAARLPVCRPCSVNLPQKSVQC